MTPKESVLVVGCDGLIGSYLHNQLDRKKYEVFGTSSKLSSAAKTRFFLDLSQDQLVIPKNYFDIVVFTAGVTAANKFKENLELCTKINYTNTIDFISKLKFGYLLFLSSCAVFDGTQAFSTYQDNTNPDSDYGKLKVRVEKFLMSNIRESSVIRLTKVLGRKFNFIDYWELEFAKFSKITVYKNHYMAPISLFEVYSAILKIIENKGNGIFQLSNNSEISYYDYAKEFYRLKPEKLAALNGKVDIRSFHRSLSTRLP